MNEATAPDELLARTRDFALRIIRLYSALPHRGAGEVLGKHLLRCGTCAGARYRDATHAKSPGEAARFLDAARQAVDETIYWLELIADSGTLSRLRLQSLRNECDELLAVLEAKARGAEAAP